MKKLLLLMSATMVLASCTKKDDPAPATPATPATPTTPTIPGDGWRLGTTSYTSVIVAKSGANIISAFDAVPSGSSPAVNSLNVYFSAFPTTGGAFTVVQYPATTPLTATQIGVTAGLHATSATYASTGSDAVTATVTITGGKLKIEIPEIWVKKTGSGATDSLKLTGTLAEQ